MRIVALWRLQVDLSHATHSSVVHAIDRSTRCVVFGGVLDLQVDDGAIGQLGDVGQLDDLRGARWCSAGAAEVIGHDSRAFEVEWQDLDAIVERTMDAWWHSWW